MNLSLELFKKYNVAVPRYTSYPTVPHWEQAPSQNEWISLLGKSRPSKGISLYIHLPFCESLCTYCACNKRITKNHAVEEKYIAALLKEAQLYAQNLPEKAVVNQLHFGGGTPTFFSAKNLDMLLKKLNLYFDFQPEGDDFSFEAHPANTTEDHLKVLFNHGFRRLSLGIQDFDFRVQKAIHRFQSEKEVDIIMQKARKIGYTSINFDLIYGLPFQTLESIKNTLKAVQKMRPERIAFYSYAHVPWKSPGQRGYSESDLPAGKAKYTLFKKGLEALDQMGYHAIGMDHFALEGDALLEAYQEGTLNRNFMGYTEHQYEMMLALGASSIGATEDAYIQNEKKIEDYYQRLDQNEFPIINGHKLTSIDKKIRGHIMELMCFQKTEIPLIAGYQYFNTLLEELKSFSSDEMIEIEDRKINITEKGKPFMRNVAAALDPNIIIKTPSSNVRFSSSV